MLSGDFCKIFKNTVFTEYLRVAASVICMVILYFDFSSCFWIHVKQVVVYSIPVQHHFVKELTRIILFSSICGCFASCYFTWLYNIINQNISARKDVIVPILE